MLNKTLDNLGELQLIKIIEKFILLKTGKALIRDDSFLFNLNYLYNLNQKRQNFLLLNSDMLVSTTDIPPQMNFYQIGRKSVLMNISDLIVKGVKPRGIIISLGLPKKMYLKNFYDLINGIIDYCIKYNLDYIGGDINETKEIIINPTVFGTQDYSKIIFRKGIKEKDILVANGKFGLTGVGFDILFSKKGTINEYPKYKRSILSVLEPIDLGKEAFILAEQKLANSSIDSSDGLAKSLNELMYSNPDFGFEIEFNESLIDLEAIKYSKKYNVPLENLVFNGGEEFIHLFTISPENYDIALKSIRSQGGQ
ncbi:MAG: thiamine-phosphate kinase, partial [Promethearchaeota archaeon]